MSLQIEYNPVLDLFEHYVNKRFTGNCYDQCFLESVVAVQTKLLRQCSFDDVKVKWFLKTLEHKQLKANLEIEFCKKYGEEKKKWH